MTDAAGPDCPPWCNSHDDKNWQHCRSRTLEPGGILVSLRLVVGDPADAVALYVGGMPISNPASSLGRSDVMSMARLLRRLGREDVAVAAEQMAAILRMN